MEYFSDNIKDYISYAPNAADKWLLHLAAFFYALPCICDIVFMLFPSLNPILNGISSPDEYVAHVRLYFSVQNVSCIIALFVLFRLANDRASRIMTICGIIANLVMCILYAASSYYSSTDLSMLIQISCILYSFVWVYLYSVLQKNKWLSASSRSWIVFLAVCQVGGVFANLVPDVYYAAIPSDLYFETRSLFYTLSSLFKVFQVIYCFLYLCSILKFAHSEIFYGSYDGSPAQKGTYNPANKYMLAAVVASGFTLGLLWLLYSNAELFV